MTRLLVCGPRDIGVTWPGRVAFDRIDREIVTIEPAVIIHGACSRLDRRNGRVFEGRPTPRE